MGCRANALGSDTVHGTEGKGKIHCFKVVANVMNLLLVLHDKTLLWHYQDLRTKLRTFCIQWMCSSFRLNVQLVGLLWSRNIRSYWVPTLGYFKKV